MDLQEEYGMRLGLVTYNWGKDWDLPTVIKNCEATGFEGVELRSTHKHGVECNIDAAERVDVARRFADSKVELVGLGTACEYHSSDAKELARQIAHSKEFIKLCHDVGGTGIKVRPNGLPKEVPVEKTIEQIGRSLNEVGQFGQGYGVEIRVEVHGRGTSELPIFKQIMDVANHPNVKVCWNCNSQDLAGQGFEYNFDLVKDRLGTIHIHDLITQYPWKKLFASLKDAKFNSWTLLEEGSPTSDPIRVMRYYRLLWETMAT